MVIDELSCLQKTHNLPEAVTGIVLKWLNFDVCPQDLLNVADRVVEIRKCDFLNKQDISHFINLQKVSTIKDQDGVRMPPYKLQRLTVHFTSWKKDLHDVFPLDCSEQVVLIFAVPDIFLKARQNSSRPTSHLLLHALSVPVLVRLLSMGLFGTSNSQTSSAWTSSAHSTTSVSSHITQWGRVG